MNLWVLVQLQLRTNTTVFQQFPAQVRVTTRFLLAMAVCCFFLQSLEGTRVAFEVTSVEIT